MSTKYWLVSKRVRSGIAENPDESQDGKSKGLASNNNPTVVRVDSTSFLSVGVLIFFSSWSQGEKDAYH